MSDWRNVAKQTLGVKEQFSLTPTLGSVSDFSLCIRPAMSSLVSNHVRKDVHFSGFQRRNTNI